MRLNRYLARAGVASRRKCDLLIQQGAITVNGQVVEDAGQKMTRGSTTRMPHIFSGGFGRPVEQGRRGDHAGSAKRRGRKNKMTPNQRKAAGGDG